MTFSGNTEKAQVVFDRIDSIDPGSTVVTQIQRLWSYCVSRGLPPQDAYRLKIVPVLGRQSLEYSTAWLYLMSEIQNEGCQVVDGHTLIESLEKELQQQITYYGNAKNLWDSIYPLLVLTGVENGLSEEIKKARYYYRRNSFHSGFYLIERLIEQGDAVRANSTLRGMVGEMNDHVKAYYSKDINRLEHNIFQLGKRNE